MKKRKGRRRMTARIYYGPDSDPRSLYWTVTVRNATRAVKVNGSLQDAMDGMPGTTIGCHLSKCVKRNHTVFGHACFLAAFTQSICLIVTRVSNGKATHAVRYAHSCGDLVKLNDIDPKKTYIKEHPEIAERSFWLRPPQERTNTATGKGHPHIVNKDKEGSKSAYAFRGALRRACEANLVSKGLESLLNG